MIDYKALPIVFIAEASTSSQAWVITLLNYGVAGVMLIYFMWKERLDREERKLERVDLERRHQENLSAQKAVENAFRTNTNSVIIGMSALKNLDSAYDDLMHRVRDDNTPKP